MIIIIAAPWFSNCGVFLCLIWYSKIKCYICVNNNAIIMMQKLEIKYLVTARHIDIHGNVSHKIEWNFDSKCEAIMWIMEHGQNERGYEIIESYQIKSP